LNILVDACVISIIFNNTHQNHSDFIPVLQRIHDGRVKMVYGGSQFNAELSKLYNYLRIIKQLRTAGKAIKLNDADVDAQAARIRTIEPLPDFDDPHLLAIIIVSKAPVICTVDARAMPFLRESRFYAKTGVSRPSIYQRAKDHAHLLP
jgi:predicted nucleic acid-binding protein